MLVRGDGYGDLVSAHGSFLRCKGGLVLARELSASKGKESIVLPCLHLRMLPVTAIVTLAATGCRTSMVQALCDVGADYIANPVSNGSSRARPGNYATKLEQYPGQVLRKSGSPLPLP